MPLPFPLFVLGSTVSPFAPSKTRQKQNNSQAPLGREAGDGIPDGKARQILGFPHRRSITTAAAAAATAAMGGAPPPGRSGPLPKRKSVRPVQASPSPLVQHKQHHFPGGGGGDGGGGGSSGPSETAAAAAAAAATRDAALFTPVGATPAPFAEGGGVPPMPVSPSGSDTQAPLAAGDVFSSSGEGVERGHGRGEEAPRGGGGVVGGMGGRSASSRSSSSGQLPPRDGQSRAAARAARLEADKIAALRHFAAEAKAEKQGGRSGGGGGGGGSASAAGSRSSSFRGSGSAAGGVNNGSSAGLMPRDDGDHGSETGMSEIDPPMLPSGELLEEGSKAWRLLMQGGPGLGVRAAPASELPSALVATSRSAEFDVGAHRSKASPSPSPPLHPRLTMEDGAAAAGGDPAERAAALRPLSLGRQREGGAGARVDGERPLSLSLVSLDIGAGAAGRVAEQWAASSNTVPTPHGGTTRRADPPLSPGAQTPPPLSPPGGGGAPDRLTLTLPSDGKQQQQPHQQRVPRFRTPLSARGHRPTWTTAAEAEPAASVVSPPGWGQASTPSGNGRSRGFSSNSATSTPKSTARGSSMWGNGNGNGGGGGSKKADEGGGGGGSMMTRTPGRLPRRLHQGVNKVKRAVGVG